MTDNPNEIIRLEAERHAHEMLKVRTEMVIWRGAAIVFWLAGITYVLVTS